MIPCLFESVFVLGSNKKNISSLSYHGLILLTVKVKMMDCSKIDVPQHQFLNRSGGLNEYQIDCTRASLFPDRRRNDSFDNLSRPRLEIVKLKIMWGICIKPKQCILILTLILNNSGRLKY